MDPESEAQLLRILLLPLGLLLEVLQRHPKDALEL